MSPLSTWPGFLLLAVCPVVVVVVFLVILARGRR
jgi:hypothetical protein